MMLKTRSEKRDLKQMEPSDVKRDSQDVIDGKAGEEDDLFFGKDGQEEDVDKQEEDKVELSRESSPTLLTSETKTDLALAEEKAKAEPKLEDEDKQKELSRESSGSADLVALTEDELNRQKQMHKSMRVLSEELRRMLNKLEGITAKAGNREGPRSYLDETKANVDTLFDLVGFESGESLIVEESFSKFLESLSIFKSQVRSRISEESKFLMEKEKKEKKAKRENKKNENKDKRKK